jgi:SAM-dependent methyltransferase
VNERQQFYDGRAPFRARESRRHYHQLLQSYYRFLVPPGARVLEIGCGVGDLLAAVQPARGVGVDFSARMVEQARARHPHLEFVAAEALAFDSAETFDYIVLSDLLNDVADVQAILEKVKKFAGPRTRLVLNVYNFLWRPILAGAEAIGGKAPSLAQNWLSNADLKNLLHLSGWELVKWDTRILWPLDTPLLAHLLNRWVAPWLRPFCLGIFMVARLRPAVPPDRHFSCSVVIPARNEAGNIEAAVQRVPEMGKGTEIIFIEGHSTDHTWDEINRVAARYPQRRIKVMRQQSKGKGGAVREAFAAASGELLFILDADLTVPPEDLPKFYEAARSGTAEFVNGVRLVYPMEDQAMRFFNLLGNKFFSFAFTALLGQPIKDTLCGTKVLFKEDYESIARNRAYFGDFDPFGDFDLLFGAAKLNLRMMDLPIRYRARTYGDTNIQRWRHGMILLRMTWFAARRMKFIA